MLARAAVVVVFVVTLAACSNDDGDGGLASRMCDAARAAGSGDVDDARDTFEDNHAGLHALADATAASDRPAAAELLRAKQEVEGALEGASGDRLRELLEDLAAATATAEGGDPPSCA